MTGSPPPPSDSVQKITVLDVASKEAGVLTLFLEEQLCCLGCGLVSARFDISVEDEIPASGLGGHDPGS